MEHALDQTNENFPSLIIFEENLTAAGLEQISAEAKTWPATAKTKEEYDLIYSEHQRFKRLRLAVTKKKDELTKSEKQKFEAEKNRISRDYDFVMGILAPLEKRLADSRQEWDDRKKRELEEKARIEAEKQKEEFERQQLIRDHAQAIMENVAFDEEKRRVEKLAKEEAERKAKADERERLLRLEKERLDKIEAERQAAAAEKEAELKAQAEKIARERREFECEKSRLDFDQAWDDAHEIPIPQEQTTGSFEIKTVRPQILAPVSDPWESDENASPLDDVKKAIDDNRGNKPTFSRDKYEQMIGRRIRNHCGEGEEKSLWHGPEQVESTFSETELSDNQEAREDLEKNLNMTPRTVLQEKQEGDHPPENFAAPLVETIIMLPGDDENIKKDVLEISSDAVFGLGALIAENPIQDQELKIEIKNLLNRFKSAHRIFSDKYGEKP